MNLQQKLINYHYFVVINSLLAIVISSYYILYLPYKLSKDLSFLLFFVVNHCSYFFLLVVIISLLALPLIMLKGITYKLSQALFATLILVILCIDLKIFKDDQIHINASIILTVVIKAWLYLKTKQLAVLISLGIIGFLAEFLLLSWIEKNNWNFNKKLITRIGLITIISFIYSHYIYNYFLVNNKYNIVAKTSYIPWFYKSNSSGFLEQKSLTKKLNSATDFIFHNAKKLNYPIKPLITDIVNNPINILIIGLDAWRADCFNAKDSPNLYNFAKQGVIFNNHFAAGNGTHVSMCGLFYSIPSSYWYNILQHQNSPIFIDRINQLNYQTSVFLSAGIPSQKIFFNKINFCVNPIETRPCERDQSATDDWFKWYNNIDKNKPFFSFIFYDSLHGLDFPENYDLYSIKNTIPTKGLYSYKKFKQLIGKDSVIESYKTGVHYIDNLVGSILERLTTDNQLANTLIIITGDHGCELDDNQQDYWGYGSNLTNCQIKVPFAIIGPKFSNNTVKFVTDLTSHFDVVPTIMKNFLSVTNDIQDYSIGKDLLSSIINRDWILATSRSPSAIKCGIIEINKITNLLLNINYYQVFNKKNLPLATKPNYKLINEAIEMTTRFLKY